VTDSVGKFGKENQGLWSLE